MATKNIGGYVTTLNASDINNTPAGCIASTDLQAGLNELGNKKHSILDTSVFVMSATGQDNGTPVSVTITTKDSGGWFISAPTAQETTSSVTVKFNASYLRWDGNYAATPALYNYTASGLGKLVISRTSSSYANFRIQKWFVVSNYNVLRLIPDGDDLVVTTSGSAVPACSVSGALGVPDGSHNEMTIVAANVEGTSTRMSVSLQWI